MIELSQAHLSTDILAHRYQGNADHGKGLECVVIFASVDVVVAVMQHALHLQHIAGASEGAHFDQNLGLLSDGM